MSSPDRVEELRSVKRFVIEPPLQGAFANVDVTIDDFGERGVQVEHAGPLKLGSVSRLMFTIPGTKEPVRTQARVAWSRLSKKPDVSGKYLYRSGLRVEGDPEVMKATLNSMIQFCIARADNSSLEKKRKALIERARARAASPVMKPILRREAEIPPDHVLLIQQARARLQTMPDEAVKWYNRARYSQANAAGDAIQHHREEIVAIWEYLERTIDVSIIARVLETKEPPNVRPSPRR
jgi:hypothetical protein